MTEVVIDTNVLVSGLINPGGAPGRIIDLLRTGGLVPVTDDRILDEYTAVLNRQRFSRYFDTRAIGDIVRFFRFNSVYMVCPPMNLELPDAGDIPLLEVAITADAILVTGNLRHFPDHSRRGASVLSPAVFISKWK